MGWRLKTVKIRLSLDYQQLCHPSSSLRYSSSVSKLICTVLEISGMHTCRFVCKWEKEKCVGVWACLCLDSCIFNPCQNLHILALEASCVCVYLCACMLIKVDGSQQFHMKVTFFSSSPEVYETPSPPSEGEVVERRGGGCHSAQLELLEILPHTTVNMLYCVHQACTAEGNINKITSSFYITLIWICLQGHLHNCSWPGTYSHTEMRA